MSPSHHPSTKLLADYVVGDCSPGAALLIASHVQICPSCRDRVAGLVCTVEANEANIGRWSVLRPGLAIARLARAGGLGEAVYRLRLAPGQSMSFVEELGIGELLVLDGGFAAAGGIYAGGDFLALDEGPIGDATIDPKSGCTCLITTDDRLMAA